MSSSFRIISVDTDDSAGFEGTGSGNVTGYEGGIWYKGKGLVVYIYYNDLPSGNLLHSY